MTSSFPQMMRVRQNFAQPQPLEIGSTLGTEFAKVRPRVKTGARIAVAVGSRGITNLAAIVTATLANLRAAGAQPFIIPAMGSHGGATPEGQCEILASYGITEGTMGVPIRSSLEVREVGTSEDGVPVFCSVEALGSDGVVLINRIKPHTDFFGAIGSGILKMCVIGLGQQAGAIAMHRAAAARLGHERAIRGMARVLLCEAPILGGVAILENQFHETAKLILLLREEIESAEDQLLVEARKLMPLLPFDEIDLLIVDRIGKNISGAGMDPNVIGRSVHGYSASLMREERPSPFIRRIFARDLTPETHGNAVGIGLADVTTARLVHAMDQRATYINALTALTPQCAKIPVYFATDREIIERVLASLALADPRAARIVRIADTLSLVHLEVSEAFREEVERRADLTSLSELREMGFDPMGNLETALWIG
jgi:Lactate racemase N-terminal domain